ncbi:TIGR00725 family protein [Thermodesulfatator atlanticus]|uniref:TIGR00725 family protein n=1 Tax=Thermodesulfatator atlanticus TaxID=501497 RepID=UPI0003B748FD|nr:TIGR00725 family protein [Thermodesulfatator atlanticus]
MDLKNRRRIAIFGAGICDEEIYNLAYEVGKLLAPKAIVYTGGLGGVMEAASRGAFEAGGITVGILPGNRAEDANPYVLVPVVTDIGHARNVVLVRTAEAAIAISGGYGTLSEIALALKTWKPVIGLRTWAGIDGVTYVDTPEEAVAKVFEALAAKREEL